MAILPWRNKIVEKAEWYRFNFGSHGTYNSRWQAIIDRDPNLENVAFCVDLLFAGGKRVRISTHDVDASSSTPSGAPATEAVFHPTLIETPDINHNYQFGSGGASLRSFTIEVGQIDFDVWDIILEFGNMAGWGEVSLIPVDGQWEDRFIIMRGDMSGGVSFGAIDEGISVEIVDPRYSIDIAITPFMILSRSEEAVEGRFYDGNFSDIPTGSNGKRFPLILNDCPHHVPAIPLFVGAVSSVVPGVPPAYNRWMVCYSHEFEVSNIYVNSWRMGSGGDWFTEASKTDSLYGAPYTTIEIASDYVADWPEPEPEWTGESWSNATVFTTLSPTRADYKPQNVVEMIRYLADNWSMLGREQVNDELFSVAIAKIGPAIPRGIINGSGESDSASVLQFIEGTLCSEFPMVSMTYHGGGYGPIITDKYSDVVRGEWVVGQGPLYARISSYNEISKSSLFNRFTLNYSYDAKDDAHLGTIVRDASNNAWCRISERLCGTLDKGVIDSKYIHDDQTAAYVADWMVGHFAIPSYEVQYAASPSVITYLRLGDNLDIYDPDIKSGTEKIRATVQGIDYSGNQCEVTLRLWPNYNKFAAGTASGALSWGGAGILGGSGYHSKQGGGGPQDGGGAKY